MDSPEGFAEWVEHLNAATEPPDGWVPATHWWITESDTVLGAIALRHRLNEKLLEAGGHIGYGPADPRRAGGGWPPGRCGRCSGTPPRAASPRCWSAAAWTTPGRRR